MNYSIPEIIRLLCSPRGMTSPVPGSSVASAPRLCSAIGAAGRKPRERLPFPPRFLRRNGRVRIVDFVPYDDLDPGCLETGIVEVRRPLLRRPVGLCARSENSTVVADVHTHPSGSGQSDSDRAHPIPYRKAGHLALILPDFAALAGMPLAAAIGIYRYEKCESAGTWCRPAAAGPSSTSGSEVPHPCTPFASCPHTLHRLVKQALDSGEASFHGKKRPRRRFAGIASAFAIVPN